MPHSLLSLNTVNSGPVRLYSLKDPSIPSQSEPLPCPHRSLPPVRTYYHWDFGSLIL